VARLFRAETAFFLLVFVIVLFAFRERGFYDPGALWHVKVGDIILDRGMPQTDPFSFTFENEKWVPQQWGAEVLMALVHRVGGLDAMLLAFTAGVALLFTLIFRRCVQGGMGPILAALVVGVCLFVGSFHYYVRPHMFTIALLGWTMMCVVDYERGRCSVWRLAGLVPLYVLWTNLHGGVLGGVMTLGLAVAGWGALFLFGRLGATQRTEEETTAPAPASVLCPLSSGLSPIKDWPTAFLLGGIVVACLLTPLVNPHGLEMLRIWSSLVGSKVLPKIVGEHMPLDLTKPLDLAVVGFGAFYIGFLLSTLPKRPHVTWLIPLVWFVLSFKGIRQAPLFAITAAVALADMWRHTLWHRLLVKYGDGSLATNTPPPATVGRAWWVIPAALVVAAFALQVARMAVPVVGYGWVRFDPNFVPADLNDAVNKHLARPGVRVFNDANLGGYLIYHAPKAKIFMDDRCELYGDEWIKNYSDAMGLPPNELAPIFEAWDAKWHFEYAVIMTNPPPQKKPSIERYLLERKDRWEEVARGQRGVLFRRVARGER
jgi:hypothetical protein